ncbi:MAG: glycosyltransferase family 4 protein [Bacteroides thetaiotaomicron]|nr:glycosyltransferase family 4 protein [Bacteroides thetaiotaomicron]
MKRILILAGRYLPGFKDGGPVRTLINLTDLLGDEYQFRLAVLDRDHGDTEPYPHIAVNAWNLVGKAEVWYYPPGGMNYSLIRKLTKDVDLVYLCGFYDAYGYKTLILNRFGLLYGKPVVLASMGSFSEGALSHKSTKKHAFISLCKYTGLFRNIIWSVTSEYEKADVMREIDNNVHCVIAEDPPRANITVTHGEYSECGSLKAIFLSRVSPQKNLLYIAQMLKDVQFDLLFDIYGPLEDKNYWEECKKALELLPRNVHWKYCGEADTNDVPSIFSRYDVFLFPTMGENYGHVIFEAMAAGCIPFISDQTPWNYIQGEEAGYVIPLSKQSEFCEALNQYSKKTVKERIQMSKNAVSVAESKVEQVKEETGYRRIFDGVEV